MYWVVKRLYLCKSKKWGRKGEFFLLSFLESGHIQWCCSYQCWFFGFVVVCLGFCFWVVASLIVLKIQEIQKTPVSFENRICSVSNKKKHFYFLLEMTLSCIFCRLITWMKMRSIFSVKLLIGNLEEDLGKSTKKGSDKQLLILLTLILWGSHLYLEVTIR